MLAFLQGFALGLLISCGPWFLVGLLNPSLADPVEPPSRLRAVARYGFVLPGVAVVLWMTSLWGGFGPGLGGWLVGLLAVAVTIPAERRLWRWQRSLAAQRARRQAVPAAERGVQTLDPERPPQGADDVVRALATVKRRLLAAARADLAGQVDRLYSRYERAFEVLAGRFDPAEVTYHRAGDLLRDVCRTAVDEFEAMAASAASVAGVDAEYVRRRLRREDEVLEPEERRALERRLELLDTAETELRRRAGRIESVLTALDDATVTLGALETGPGHAPSDAADAMAELRHFLDGAQRYRRDTDGLADP